MNFAIVTPSYAPDFDQCKLLCETVEQWVDPTVQHYLIVDKRDLELFKKLENHRTHVITVESILPWWIRRLPKAKKWWLSLKSLPIRNWFLQQIVKLSVATFIDADAYIFVDSDVCFIRPFTPDTFVKNEKVRLFRVPGAAQLPTHFKWHRTASQLLGLPVKDYHGSTYIGNLITWRRDHLLQMYAHIEKTTGRGWREAICQHWHLSEYILYGIFVEHVLGESNLHNYEDVPVCHISWDYELNTDEEIEHFFNEVQPNHVAVMVSAKQNVPVRSYYSYILDYQTHSVSDTVVCVAS